jgi:hypothetical protein
MDAGNWEAVKAMSRQKGLLLSWLFIDWGYAGKNGIFERQAGKYQKENNVYEGERYPADLRTGKSGWHVRGGGRAASPHGQV